MVHFVGAGSGAPDLITVRGRRLLRQADVIIYAGSLINKSLLEEAKPGAACHDSARLTLEQVLSLIWQAEEEGKTTVRLHTGDPSLYGAIREQMDALEQRGVPYDVTPGVSSFCGAAAALGLEYTLPGISQTVILTRMAGRTPVPRLEEIEGLSAHQATMVVFLSAGQGEELQQRLLNGGYREDTPAAIVYKATWPEEESYVTTVGRLAGTLEEHGITKTAMILVGDVVGTAQGAGAVSYERTKLYDPEFSTGFRKERGIVYVTGIGPGGEESLTLQAKRILEECDTIIGYTSYVEMIRDRYPQKRFLSTPMREEIKRCRMAFEEAREGKMVALICSGDAGVYGMSGPMLELQTEYRDIEVEVVSGVTACVSGAAVLGAPLMHDFAVISLSDLLTPWAKIEKRLRMAAEADFVICLYNPASKKRADYLERACGLILEFQPPGLVCGIVEGIGTKQQKSKILTLGELQKTRVNMSTTVFVGNSQTKVVGGRMVTPRGYLL